MLKPNIIYRIVSISTFMFAFSSCNFEPFAGKFDKKLVESVRGCYFYELSGNNIFSLKIDDQGNLFSEKKIGEITFLFRNHGNISIDTDMPLVLNVGTGKVELDDRQKYMMNFVNNSIQIHSSNGHIGYYSQFNPVILKRLNCSPLQ